MAPASRSLKFPPLSPATTLVRLLKMEDVLQLPPVAGAQVIAGASGLGRPVQHVNVMQIPTNRFAKPNELLLAAGQVFRHLEEDPGELLASLAESGICALAVRTEGLGRQLGSVALEVAEQSSVAVIELGERSHLNEIHTAVLEKLVSANAARLESAAKVRERLDRHVLSGQGVSELPSEIGHIIGGAVHLFDDEGDLVATSRVSDATATTARARAWLAGDENAPVELDRSHVLWPVRAGYKRLGCLVAEVPGPPPDDDAFAALEHGATIAGLQILHQREAREASVAFQSTFLRDLLSGTLDVESAAERAPTIGWDPSQSFEAVLVSVPDRATDDLVEEIRRRSPEAIAAPLSGKALAMIPTPSDDAGDQMHPLYRTLMEASIHAHIGISALHTGLYAFAKALLEAEEALGVATVFARSTRVRRFDELGPLRLLSTVPIEALATFCINVLSPLGELDEDYRNALEETLDRLIEANLNVAEAARLGGWHYNTLRYRIERLSDLLGPFMEDGTILDSIALALLLRRELPDTD